MWIHPGGRPGAEYGIELPTCTRFQKEKGGFEKRVEEGNCKIPVFQENGVRLPLPMGHKPVPVYQDLMLLRAYFPFEIRPSNSCGFCSPNLNSIY